MNFLTLQSLIPCVLSLGLFLPAAAATLPLPVTEHALKNGLRVLIVERHESPTFSAHVRFPVGSANDPPGFTGLAHFVEHMMFKGTRLFGSTNPEAEEPLLNRLDSLQQAMSAAPLDTASTAEPLRLQEEYEQVTSEARRLVLPNELWETYRRNGGTNINAVTVRDSTQYYVGLPKNRFELWALLESDRLRSPVFREFSNEREVIREEYRQMVEANASAYLLVSTYHVAFGATPYRHPIWGWPADLQRITRQVAQDFAATYYVPNNAYVVLVGDLNPREVLPVLDRYFGDLPTRTVPPTAVWRVPEQTALQRVNVDFPAEPQLAMLFQAPPYGPETETLSLIASLLVNGRTSRLHKALVEEQRIATGITSDTSWFLKHAGLFTIIGLPRSPHSVEELEAGIWREIERLASTGISPAELERVQNQAELAVARETRSNAGLAAQLARAWDLNGDWRSLFTRQNRIRAITPEAIRQVVQRYQIPARCTIGRLTRASDVPTVSGPPPGITVPFENGDLE
jgi:predicted Zn-dependent peptidase